MDLIQLLKDVSVFFYASLFQIFLAVRPYVIGLVVIGLLIKFYRYITSKNV